MTVLNGFVYGNDGGYRKTDGKTRHFRARMNGEFWMLELLIMEKVIRPKLRLKNLDYRDKCLRTA